MNRRSALCLSPGRHTHVDSINGRPVLWLPVGQGSGKGQGQGEGSLGSSPRVIMGWLCLSPKDLLSRRPLSKPLPAPGSDNRLPHRLGADKQHPTVRAVGLGTLPSGLLPSAPWVAQLVKNLLAMQEMLVQFLGREGPLEKG